MARDLKLGKKEAVDRPKDFKFTAYRSTDIHVPDLLGFINVFGGQWPMLGNDQYGDCVWAGGDHETQFLNWIGLGAHRAIKLPPVEFTDQNALSDYASTGFNPSDPATDQGTDVGQALEYRRNTGLVDAQGNRHKIGAYVRLTPGNLDHLHEALYLFEAVGIGIQFPDSAMDQFNSGQPWSPLNGSPIEGGHYVPVIASKPGMLYCVTWGKTQPMTEAFYTRYCDEAYGILSVEGLYRRAQVTYSGYNWSQLLQDANLVGSLS